MQKKILGIQVARYTLGRTSFKIWDLRTISIEEADQNSSKFHDRFDQNQ